LWRWHKQRWVMVVKPKILPFVVTQEMRKRFFLFKIL
jgi:hypothetical protein